MKTLFLGVLITSYCLTSDNKKNTEENKIHQIINSENTLLKGILQNKILFWEEVESLLSKRISNKYHNSFSTPNTEFIPVIIKPKL